MRMSPLVPGPPLSVGDVVFVGWVWTWVEVSGAGGGRGANGLCCASAGAGAASARAASASTRRRAMDGNLALGEQALQPRGVAHGEALPLVVEVEEGLAAGGQVAHLGGPLGELGVGVVAAPAARAPVDAHDGEVAGGRRLGQRAARVVRQHGVE